MQKQYREYIDTNNILLWRIISIAMSRVEPCVEYVEHGYSWGITFEWLWSLSIDDLEERSLRTWMDGSTVVAGWLWGEKEERITTGCFVFPRFLYEYLITWLRSRDKAGTAFVYFWNLAPNTRTFIAAGRMLQYCLQVSLKINASLAYRKYYMYCLTWL